MTFSRILISKTDLAQVTKHTAPEAPAISDGQVLLEADAIALSANNISYAATGDMLGYWNFFPAEAGQGCVPVWGFARVAASRHADLSEGELVFGYLPMATHLVLEPAQVADTHFSDASAHRAGMSPWYNRYYRCAQDPAYTLESAPLQPALWALFMTGWMMADDLAEATKTVVISSASSKTALALAWSLKQRRPEIKVVGLTSQANVEFTAARSVCDRVVRYDDVANAMQEVEGATYVDIAGNAAVTSAVHVALGEQLVDSVLIGGTHRAPGEGELPMPGPAPRFFFIPDVAEASAAEQGFDGYHRQFASAWLDFAPWAAAWVDTVEASGPDAVLSAYESLLAGGLGPEKVLTFTWR